MDNPRIQGRAALALCVLFTMQGLSFAQGKEQSPARKNGDSKGSASLGELFLRERDRRLLNQSGLDLSTEESTLVVLAACSTWNDVGIMRRGLETERTRKSIREPEYLKQSNLLNNLADYTIIHFAAHSLIEEDGAKSYVENLLEESRKSSVTEGESEFNSAWFDLFWRHFELERDRAAKSITEDQYRTLITDLRKKELELATKHSLTPQQMQTYYARVADLPNCFVSIEKTLLSQNTKSAPPTQAKKDERPLDVKVASIIGLLLALSGAVTGLFFAWSKYQVESKERKLKELQIEELSRKLAEESAPKLITA